VVDPRSRYRYLSSHIPTAISVPASGAFGSDGKLLSVDGLAQWLGRSGVSNQATVVLYGDADGQALGMLSWVLVYLGHPDVAVLGTRFERWRDEGGELAYRPVAPTPTTFNANANPELRATWEDAASPGTQFLVDVRSPEEYRGERVVAQDPPGHIPGALNLPWLSFVGEKTNLLVDPAHVASQLRGAGAERRQGIIVYGRSGCTRASVAWLAMQLAGRQVRMYDGSFLDWSQRDGLPIETEDRRGVAAAGGPNSPSRRQSKE
jgi:thiosulfate/3-mercaptopyruvate sulfurtransferase